MTIRQIGIQSEKSFPLTGRWERFAAIIDPRFPDYMPQGMKGMSMKSVPQLCSITLQNCRPSDILVKYSREGGDSPLGIKKGGGGRGGGARQLLKRSDGTIRLYGHSGTSTS